MKQEATRLQPLWSVTKPDASVVIATYNRKNVLLRAVAALFEQTAYGEAFEIVVVDDGSEDGTEEACLVAFAGAGFLPLPPADGSGCASDALAGSNGAASYGYRERGTRTAAFARADGLFVRYAALERHAGPAAARNRGVEMARGETVVFLDSDLLASPGLVATHLACQAKGGRRVICHGPVVQVADLGRAQGQQRARLTDISRAFFATGNVSVPRAALVEAGLFDEEFREYGWEDLELGLRLRRLGLTVARRADAVGYHYKRPFAVADLDALLRRERERGHTAVVFWRKWPVARVQWATLITPAFFAMDRVLAAGGWPTSPKTVGWLGRLEKRRGLFWRLVVRFLARIITLHAYAEGLREALAAGSGQEQELLRQGAAPVEGSGKGDESMAQLAELLAKLKAEHPIAVKMLEHLGKTVEQLRNGKPFAEARPELEKFQRFLEDVLYDHFRPEEQALFPALLRGSGKDVWDLVKLLLDEHHAIEQHNRDLKAALAAKAPDPAQFAKIGAALVMALTSHIYKEDNKLFPLVEERLAAEQQSGGQEMPPAMPRRESIETIVRAFGPNEHLAFLRELYDAAVLAVRSGTPEDLEAVRRVLLDWEYTAYAKGDPEFLARLRDLKKEMAEDKSPGVHWTSLLGD